MEPPRPRPVHGPGRQLRPPHSPAPQPEPNRRRVPFHLDLSLNVTGLEPGGYAVVYTLHDAVSGKTTRFEVPFTISDRAA